MEAELAQGPGLAALTFLMTFPPTRQLLKETTPGSFCEVLEMGRLWSLMSWKERRFGSCCGWGWPGLWEGGLLGSLGFDRPDNSALDWEWDCALTWMWPTARAAL